MNNVSILIVDDSEVFVDLLLATLNSAGFVNNTVAHNGLEGLKEAENGKFDLIITDIYMPKMNGITMITRIRELPNYKRVPILVLSVEFDQEYKKKGKSIGATGWIVKPFIPAQLVKAINFCLNRK
jgi:two-component system, chemotaxis family, chemotaxis protein CheY